MGDGLKVKKAICMWCRGWCHVNVHVDDGKLVKIEENPKYPRPPFPPVRACHRALAAKEWFYHPDRLNYPLKRAGERGEGRWKQISWEQALDEIAERLARIRDEHGAEAVGTSVGTGRTQDEIRTRFFNLFGSPNSFGQANICMGPRSVMAEAIVGWFPSHSVGPKTKCVLLLGLAPEVARKAEYKLMRDAIKEGAKLIVIDPRRTKSASEADLWLQLRPGTDSALLMGMINIVIREALYDNEFIKGLLPIEWVKIS